MHAPCQHQTSQHFHSLIALMENTSFAILIIPSSLPPHSYVVKFFSGSYNYGYEVGPNRQFHHEIRGTDGVTYGCFGYVNPDEKLLVTHYVADAHGYRLIQSDKPVKIFPIAADPK